MITEWFSVEEFSLAADRTRRGIEEGQFSISTLIDPPSKKNSWAGNISWNQAVEKGVKGDESYVDGATKLMDSINIEGLPNSGGFETVRSPFGARVSSGEWLAGSPTPCRRRVKRSRDTSPIKIVVSLTSSCGIDSETMRKRGEAILAFLMLVQRYRPVDLMLLNEVDGTSDGWNYQLIRVESKPLALGIAGFALANVGFARHLCYGYAAITDGFSGGWPRDHYLYGKNKEAYEKARIERCGLSDEDIVIGEVTYDDPMVTNPEAWIRAQLVRIKLIETGEQNEWDAPFDE